MKKIYSLAIVMMAGVLAMTSCSNDDEMLNESARVINPNEIAFDTGQKGISSKSGTTVTSLTDFYVRASTSDDEVYFDGEHFSYDGSAFRSERNHYWPITGTLNFYASNIQEDITNANKVENYECDGENDWVTATVKAGEKTIPYPLTFQHVLSQIKISAEAKDKEQDLEYKVVGVKMTTPNKGTYTFADATSGSGTWEIDNSSSADYTFSGNMGVAFGEDDTWQGSDYWNILPIADGTITFDVQYQVIQNGQVIGDFTGVNSKQVTVEAPNLLSGKIYIYNFVLAINSEDVITFTVNNTSWIDGSIIDIAVENPFLCEFTLTDGSSVKIKDINNTRNDLHNGYTSPYKTTLQHAEIGKLCTYIDVGAFNNCSELTSITIPNSVIRIGASAFRGCKKLTSVTIPESVTTLGTSCLFYDCQSLTSVKFPNSVADISDYCFYGCRALTSVVIPSSVTSIGKCAFMFCSGLMSITIPNSITNIGSSPFVGCKKLYSLNFTGTKQEWNNITKSSDWKEANISVIHCTDGDVTL